MSSLSPLCSGLFGGIGTGVLYCTTVGVYIKPPYRLSFSNLPVFLIFILIMGVVVALVFLLDRFGITQAGRSQYLLSWPRGIPDR